MGDPVHFVVTGCARSGTGYTAALFNELGMQCGHDEVFGPRREGFTGFRPFLGESSWMTAPFLARLPEGTVILHQVRDPAKVIASLMSTRFFHDDPVETLRRKMARIAKTSGKRAVQTMTGARERAQFRTRRDYVEFARMHTPEVFSYRKPLARCARYWALWNQLAETNAGVHELVYLRYRIEDLDSHLLSRIVQAIGASPRVDPAVALSRVPTNTNTRPRDRSLQTSDILEVLADQSMAALMTRYGYELGF